MYNVLFVLKRNKYNNKNKDCFHISRQEHCKNPISNIKMFLFTDIRISSDYIHHYNRHHRDPNRLVVLQSPLEEIKYLLKFIFPFLPSGVEAKARR